MGVQANPALKGTAKKSFFFVLLPNLIGISTLFASDETNILADDRNNVHTGQAVQRYPIIEIYRLVCQSPYLHRMTDVNDKNRHSHVTGSYRSHQTYD